MTLKDLEADFKKLFEFCIAIAPTVTIVDPAAAPEIAAITAVIKALQPVVSAVQSANGGTLDHAALVSAVTNVVNVASPELVNMGVMSANTGDHIRALTPIIGAAVAASGLATPTATA